MSEQPEALRLADWMQNAVQTYPQMSEDEPGGYNTEVDQVMDEAAAQLRRLHALCEEMGEALRYYCEEFTGSEPSVSVLDRKADEALAKWKESK